MINLMHQTLLREKNERKRARMGYKIHAARIAQKMTQTDLANLVGVSQVRISEIERGVGARRKGVVEQIKKALNMPTNKKVPAAFFDKVGKGTPDGEHLRMIEILNELNREAVRDIQTAKNKHPLDDKVAVGLLCLFGVALILLLVNLFAAPYFEMQAFNRCTQGQATYWEAMFSNLQITNCK